MKVTKRQFLAGAVLAGAGAGLLVLRSRRKAVAGTADDNVLAIYDGRSAAGRRLAAEARRHGIRALDLAAAPEAFWRQARSGFGLPEGAQLFGVTGWDERVYLASALRERGLRVRHETRVDDRMFEWRIA
jgi:hypothetical protein